MSNRNALSGRDVPQLFVIRYSFSHGFIAPRTYKQKMPPLSGDGAWSFRIAFRVLIRKADRVIFPPRRKDAKLFGTSLLFRSKKSVSGCYAGEHNAYKHNLRQVNKVQGFNRACGAGSRVQPRLRRGFKGSTAPAARVQGFNRAFGAGSRAICIWPL